METTLESVELVDLVSPDHVFGANGTVFDVNGDRSRVVAAAVILIENVFTRAGAAEDFRAVLPVADFVSRRLPGHGRQIAAAPQISGATGAPGVHKAGIRRLAGVPGHRSEVVEIGGVHPVGLPDLLDLTDATGDLRTFPRFVQRRKQH